MSILDLLPPGVSKGWALERLAGRLGVDRKETMAIGDNWNDVDMLEWAGQGVMMGNAAQELRTMAKMRGWKQAPPNDEDGVAVVLETEVARLAAAKVGPEVDLAFRRQCEVCGFVHGALAALVTAGARSTAESSCDGQVVFAAALTATAVRCGGGADHPAQRL